MSTKRLRSSTEVLRSQSSQSTTDGSTQSDSSSLREVSVTIDVADDFDLAKSICSYGFFVLAPNKWCPPPPSLSTDHGVFKRPLRYGEKGQHVCDVTLTMGQGTIDVSVATSCPLDDGHLGEIKQQICRMCRVSFPIDSWWSLHSEAKSLGFGRLFRSPTLWEDMVKTITVCNVHWKRTCIMNRLLCDKVSSHMGSFPSPSDVLKFSPEWLQRECNLGYRATRLYKLASAFTDGTIDVAWWEHSDRTQQEVWDACLSLNGFGPFATNNVLQLMGFLETFPYDSETVRHFRECHKVIGSLADITKKAKQHYAKYAPYQFVAYWFELWKGYQQKDGVDADRWEEGNAALVISCPQQQQQQQQEVRDVVNEAKRVKRGRQ
ncbi:unnamed protein product [Vitrella brassicaformis CCMP3155]|uniref:HhH-GPD domain-containing protein n=1 Tax=Vitrella brassicaformis (strain CCMP3155) TaxID=1169540 RepID=A0A0G4H2A2_VITBC|nr:unnamed protein product [Vitrella brassicaformis CCMP3155]|eukprot:CEM37777.1 unnamed protein product [Vitrella brassicaformis CCMP3155]